MYKYIYMSACICIYIHISIWMYICVCAHACVWVVDSDKNFKDLSYFVTVSALALDGYIFYDMLPQASVKES